MDRSRLWPGGHGASRRSVRGDHRDRTSHLPRRLPERPFTLVGQQYLADPSRSAGRINPLWVYAHVPQLHRRRHRTDPPPDRALHPASASTSSRPPSARPHASPPATPTTSGRHPHGCQPRAAAGRSPPLRLRLLRHRHARHVHLLGRQPAGRPVPTACGYHAAGSALRRLRIEPLEPPVDQR